MEKCNNISLQIDTISFVTLDIISNNYFKLKQKVSNLKIQYEGICQNSKIVIDNLRYLSVYIKNNNFYQVHTLLKNNAEKLDSIAEDFNNFKSQYDQTLKYNESLKDCFNHYNLLHREYDSFFANNFSISEKHSFYKIADQIRDFRNNIILLKNLINKVDFAQTSAVLDKLSKTSNSLLLFLQTIYTYKIVLNFYSNNCNLINDFIKTNYRSIATSDFPLLENIKTNFLYYLDKFRYAYNNAIYSSWKNDSLNLSKEFKKIINFIETKKYTQAIIKQMIEAIDEKTSILITNYDKIINELAKAKDVFANDNNILNHIDIITTNVQQIKSIVTSMNKIKIYSYDQQIDALKGIFIFDNKIDQCKKSIAFECLTINNEIKEFLAVLKDTFLTYNQLLYCYDYFETFFNLNIDQNNDYFLYIKGLLDNAKQNVDLLISSKVNKLDDLSLFNIKTSDTISKIILRINTNILLKSYCDKMLMYCNLLSAKSNTFDQTVINQANQLYHDKSYSQMLDYVLTYIEKR